MGCAEMGERVTWRLDLANLALAEKQSKYEAIHLVFNRLRCRSVQRNPALGSHVCAILFY